MRLERITGAMLRRALAEYMEEAWGSVRPVTPPPDLSAVGTAEDALPLMEDETHRREGAIQTRKWVLRLGNSRYRHMKLALEEFFLKGEFVLSVDTHDAAPILPGDPDERKWRELHSWNRALKHRIEERWRRAGLPTYTSILEVLAKPPGGRSRPPGSRDAAILVVDDEPDLAAVLEATLVADGFTVRTAADGAEAVSAAERDPPDLILMDWDMPRMTGAEACARLRRGRRTRGVPILLATAAMVDLSQMADADGFLVKPYQRDVLLSFVRHLAKRRPRPADGGEPAARRTRVRPARRRGRRVSFRRPSRPGPLVSGDRSADE